MSASRSKKMAGTRSRPSSSSIRPAGMLRCAGPETGSTGAVIPGLLRVDFNVTSSKKETVVFIKRSLALAVRRLFHSTSLRLSSSVLKRQSAHRALGRERAALVLHPVRAAGRWPNARLQPRSRSYLPRLLVHNSRAPASRARQPHNGCARRHPYKVTCHRILVQVDHCTITGLRAGCIACLRGSPKVAWFSKGLPVALCMSRA